MPPRPARPGVRRCRPSPSRGSCPARRRGGDVPPRSRPIPRRREPRPTRETELTASAHLPLASALNSWEAFPAPRYSPLALGRAHDRGLFFWRHDDEAPLVHGLSHYLGTLYGLRSRDGLLAKGSPL